MKNKGEFIMLPLAQIETLKQLKDKSLFLDDYITYCVHHIAD